MTILSTRESEKQIRKTRGKATSPVMVWVTLRYGSALQATHLLQGGACGNAAQLLPQLLQLLHRDSGGHGRGAKAGNAAGGGSGCQFSSFFGILLEVLQCLKGCKTGVIQLKRQTGTPPFCGPMQAQMPEVLELCYPGLPAARPLSSHTILQLHL